MHDHDWMTECRDLQLYCERLRGRTPALAEEVEATVKLLDHDLGASLVRARRALEVIVIELCECQLERERGTEPLDKLLTGFKKIVPDSPLAAMVYLNKLGNLGAHPKPIRDKDVRQALAALARVLDWYLHDYGQDADPQGEGSLPGVQPSEPEDAAVRQGSSDRDDQGPPEPHGKRLAILYKRRVEPDGRLLQMLESSLTADGHWVFVDRHLRMGVEWAREIESEIRAADAVIVLLSRDSVTSEMLMYEVEIAAKAAHEHEGKPRLLPVRLDFEDPLPPELAPHLERLQYVLWRGTDDDGVLLDGVGKALIDSPVRPVPMHPLERDTGAVPLDSNFYVVRRADGELETAIARCDSIVLVKGARQMGKTSLLARAIQGARQRGTRVLLTDLQKLAADQFASLDVFLRAIAEIMADQLDLDVFPEDVWRPGRSPNTNFERYLRREVLEPCPEPLLWALDEVDRLFSCPFGGDVLALFRTWHNECALDPGKPWRRMTLAIAYATEAHLFITDPNQSPFNVGTKLELADFSREQVANLNRRYGSPLREPAEFLQLYSLLNGQPYLTRRALNLLVSDGLRLPDLEAVSDCDDGPFADHLRRLLLMLGREPTLMEAVQQVLAGGACPDYERFYRLRSAGILAGDSKDTARPRCGLYERYLRRQLA
ncbi:TIR protein [Thiorhodococcus drewsii AZ1]|uniref:TIR protein n=1 Tax=Thiorhodococcus drewsii AZ1 TaxID=765913 RepID=G2E898_9GAMM|nr:AAA-like domain-containing protein [Thiorhodococcus drewsii]EGV27678.1 TIR protein [Thiorhodococcus drewsii AZ1]